MSATFGGRTGRQGKLSQWLLGRRAKEAAAPDGGGREALLLAAAAAGLPLAPAAHPAPGYGCSCRTGPSS
ncbi:DNA primase, partial [Streptomyces sp. NPDC005921]